MISRFSVVITAVFTLATVNAGAVAQRRYAATRICIALRGREPLRCLTRTTAVFSSPRLYAVSRFLVNTKSAQQVWYFNNRIIFQKTLRHVRRGWRAETNVSIAGRGGIWRLELRGADGKKVQSIEFIVSHSRRFYRARILRQVIHVEDSSPTNAQLAARLKMMQPEPAIEVVETPDGGIESVQSRPAPTAVRNNPVQARISVPKITAATPSAPPPQAATAPPQDATKSPPQAAASPPADLAAAPPAQPSTTVESSLRMPFSFGIGGAIDFARISSTQTSNSAKMKLVSQPLLKLELQGQYFWDENKATLARITFENNSYQTPSGKTFDSMPKSLTSLLLQQRWASGNWPIAPEAGFALVQNFFDEATTSTNLKFSTVMEPELLLGADLPVYSARQLSHHLALHVLYEMPQSTADYKISGSWGWQFGWHTDFEMHENRQWQFAVDYKNLAQKTSFIDRDRENLQFTAIMDWR